MKHIGFAAITVVLLAAPAWAQWSEDFQSYTLGAGINGQGGWIGWDGNPTAAVVTGDHAKFPGDQVVKMAANDDCVQVLSGYTSGAWVFQCKQYIPSANHGGVPESPKDTFFILMNTYNAGGPKGWACQLHMDLLHDLVVDAEAADGFVPVVYDAWVDIRVEIDLDANFKTTYYNGTKLGTSPWYYVSDTTNHHKAIGALDLWADDGGDGVCYDDITLTAGTPVTLGNDLTSYPGVASRYLVNLGRERGETVFKWSDFTGGLYDYFSAGGNQNLTWHLNNADPWWNSVMVTFYGASPDYFGYKFKLPATINQIIWWNAVFIDGGTFAAAPQVQYLDAVNGAWQTITDVTWSEPYDSVYGWTVTETRSDNGEPIATNYSWGVRRYVVTLNNPPANVWGIRLYGDTQPGVDDHGGATPTGFTGVTEMTLYGQVNATVDLTHNLALGATGIMSTSQIGNPNALTDGNLLSYDTTWGGGNSIFADEDNYVGVSWIAPQTQVGAIGIILNGFADGGLFQGENMRVEYTTNGATWTQVTGLNLGRYPRDEPRLMATAVSWSQNYDQQEGSNDTSHLFTFDTIPAGIIGIRVIGPAEGIGWDNDGFVGCYEVEVFARPTP
jgi:hypothetical protein